MNTAQLFQKFFSTFFLFLTILCFGISSTFAAEIYFTADKTTGTTDDIFHIHLSVDGEVDNNQLGIQGLENFEIVGQQSTSQFQNINGKVKSIQEKILSLHAKKAGKFTLSALAKKDEVTITSDPITFEIQKSLIQTTKENLLKTSSSELSNSKISQKTENNSGTISAKNLLTTPSQTMHTSQDNSQIKLKEPKIQKFPIVEHISAFNAIFWIEFFGILLLLVAFFWGVQKILRKK